MILTGTLFDTKQPIYLYIVKGFLLSIIPALGVALILDLAFPAVEQPDIAFKDLNPVLIFVLLVILPPILETLMMWFFIGLIQKLTKHIWLVAIISAFIWGVLHSLQVPIWGLVVFWSFVVFSVSFQVWMKVSRSHAFWVTASIHACQNFVPFIAVLFE